MKNIVLLFALYFCLATVFTAQCIWPSNSLAEDDPGSRKWVLEYGLHDRHSGRQQGTVTIEITEYPHACKWHEKRHYGPHDTETFEVMFDPGTLMPVTYKRRIRSREEEKVISMEIAGRKLTATFRNKNGVVSTRKRQLPKGRFVIEPLFKYYISRAVDTASTGGRLNLVCTLDDEIKIFPVSWELVTTETIEVPAGKIECFKLRITPDCWYIKLINNSQHVWLDAAGPHHIVRTPLKRGLFGEKMSMTLINRRSSKNVKPDDHPTGKHRN